MRTKEQLDILHTFGDGDAKTIVHEKTNEYGVRFPLARPSFRNARKSDARDIPFHQIQAAIDSLTEAEKFILEYNKNRDKALKRLEAVRVADNPPAGEGAAAEV